MAKNEKLKATATFANGSIEGIVKEYNQAGKVIKKLYIKIRKKLNK